jgi:hypothetical protein
MEARLKAGEANKTIKTEVLDTWRGAAGDKTKQLGPKVFRIFLLEGSLLTHLLKDFPKSNNCFSKTRSFLVVSCEGISHQYFDTFLDMTMYVL